jgi:hypothetical protein
MSDIIIMISNNTKVFLLFSVLLLVQNLNLNSKKAESLRCKLRGDLPQPQPTPAPIPNVIPTPQPIYSTGLLPPPKEEQNPQPQPQPQPQPTPAPKPAPEPEGYGNVRYVLIRSNPNPDQGILGLSAVLVRNEKMENIAKGKTATYSPPWPHTNPANVLSGREAYIFNDDVYTTSARGDGFYKIDLGVPSFVKQVEIWNRGRLNYRQIGQTVALLDENNKEIIVSEPLLDARKKTIVDFKRRYVPKQFSPTQKVNGQCTGAATVRGVRYVKVMSRIGEERTQYFGFSQLAVYNNNNVNVAEKKPCTQSSSRDEGVRKYDCSNALDGNLTPRPWNNLYLSGWNYKEWFVVDLQSAQEVSKIVLVTIKFQPDNKIVWSSMEDMRFQLLDENNDILKEYVLEKASQTACIIPY